MTNSNDPEQIRREIEQTRRDLSRNVDALTDQVAPSNLARREANRVGESLRGLKERVMGSDDQGNGYETGYGRRDAMTARRDELMDRGAAQRDGVVSQAGDLKDQAAARLAEAQGAVQGAPAAARRQTRGNPIGAGLVAFGVGALIGGLMPSTQKERAASVALKEKAQPLVEEAKGVAQEAVENLKPQAQAAVDAVKEHAADAAQTVQAEGQDAAQSVKASTQDAAQSVKSSAQDSAQSVKASAQDAKDEVQATREG